MKFGCCETMHITNYISVTINTTIHGLDLDGVTIYLQVTFITELDQM